MKKFLLLLISIFFISSVGIFADSKHVCAEDAKKNCKGVEKGKLMKCLVTNESKLSSGCKGFIEKKRDEYKKKVVSNCKADAKKLCKETKSGDGKIFKCLKENKDKLSSNCKGVLFPQGKSADDHVEEK